jgi:TorA maturation chaperone TorD
MPAMEMRPEEIAVQQPACDLACEVLYRFLAAALADPRWPGRLDAVGDAERQMVEAAVRKLLDAERKAANDEALTMTPLDEAEVARLVATAAESIGRPEEYYRVFGLVTCHDCPPYETEYQPVTDAFFRAQEMADIAGFYRAFGLAVRRDLGERPDHIALELEFMALLLAKGRLAVAENDPARSAQRAAVCDDAQIAFFRDHLGWWAGGFAQLVQQKAQSGPLAAASRLLALLIARDRERLKLPACQRPVAPVILTQEPCDTCLAGQEADDGDLPLVVESGCRPACSAPQQYGSSSGAAGHGR